ncbi:T9SS type A sorting domain-containing protein [candidate division KSB1 bacterium]|nr:T9SS type A sorting domain-containing protein [candidate division KSB1 bacterium]
MNRQKSTGMTILTTLLLVFSINASLSGAAVYIKNFSSFPAYPYNTSEYKKYGAFVGCGPTTGAMIFGYFQHVNGLSGSTGLLTNPGSGESEGLNTAWALHGSTYMNTDSDGFGSAYDIEPGLENYATLRGYKVEVLIHVPDWYSPSSKDFDNYGPYGTSWMNDGIFWSKSGDGWDINASKFCDFADAKLAAGVPIFLAIDTDLSGGGDHWVAMVGYNRSTMKYAFYDTYSTELKWADIYYCMKTPHKDNAISYVRTVEYKGQLNNPPGDLVALTGYHSAVPLAWNKPTDTMLLTKLSALQVEESISDGNLAEQYEDYPMNRTILNSFSATDVNDVSRTSTQTQAAAPSSYNVYRATSSGGSYTKIASNVIRQYYRDATAANGTTYYYKITANYSSSESDYSNIASAAPKTDGYVVNSGWAATAPTLDGVITRSEWEQAATVNITYPGATGTVLLYVMNNSSTLFVAVDDKRDTHQNNWDQVGITFDENLDREWPASGSSDSEGNLWLAWDATTTSAISQYEPCQGYWPDNIVWLTYSKPAGVNTNISMSSGNMQYEGSINLSSSPLNATIGSTIGLRVFSYDKAIENFTGFWPQQAERLKIITPNYFGQAPFSFANVNLTATAPKLAVNPTELDYGDSKTSMTFEISNAATGVLAWSVSENPDKTWITSISPSSGSGRGNVQVVINRNLLAQNVETGSLLVTSNGGNKTVTVIAARDTLSQWIHKDIEKKLTANDGAEQDFFGISAAIDGIYAAVGAHQDDNDKGADAGAVYIYTRSGETWTENAKLVAPDGAAGDYFGYDVDISGDYMVVGSCWDDDLGENSGSVYIYKRSGSTWSMQKKITASDGGVDNRFGNKVAISGNYVIIGAFSDSDFGTRSGSAYIFERSGTDWIQRTVLHANDGAANDWFGISVSIDGDYAAVGSRFNDNANGADAGAVYIFKRSGTDWLQQKKIIANDGVAEDLFHVTALKGDYLAVGAYQEDDKGSNSGSVYVYHRSGEDWIQADKLTASDGAADDNFGNSLAFDNNRLVIGAYRNNDRAEDSGSIYIFEMSGVHWTEKQKIIASDGSGGDYFGLPVDIHQNYVIVSAQKADDKGTNAGAAYIYELGSITAVPEKPTATEIPDNFVLHQNYPNPFNPETTIQFSLPHAENVNISIYNMQGKLITILANERREAGIHRVTWNASHETTGLYVCRLQTGGYSKTIKLLLVK